MPTVDLRTDLQTRSLRENSNFDAAVPMTTFIVGKHEKKSAPLLPGSAVPVFKNCHGALHKVENCLGAQGDCLVPFNVC